MDFPGHGLSSHRPPGLVYDAYQYVADIKHMVEGEPLYIYSFCMQESTGSNLEVPYFSSLLGLLFYLIFWCSNNYSLMLG